MKVPPLGCRSRSPGAIVVYLLFLQPLCLMGCPVASSLEILDLQVVPEGQVSLCEDVHVSFRVDRPARFALVSGDRTVAQGFTEGAIEQLTVPSATLSPDATTLELFAVAESGMPKRSEVDLLVVSTNTRPIARIGWSGEVSPGESIPLDASLSEDPDGDELTFSWELVRGEATLSGASLTVIPGTSGAQVALTAFDPSGASHRTEASITVEQNNRPPVLEQRYMEISASPEEQVVIRPEPVDPDGDDLQLEWRQIAGPYVSVDDATAELVFTASAQRAVYVFELIACDATDSSHARIIVTVDDDQGDVPPVPRVEGPSSVAALSLVTVHGSVQEGHDSEDIWYEWAIKSAPAGSIVTRDQLSAQSGWQAKEAQFIPDIPGDYEISLRAGDALGLSPEDPSIKVSARLAAKQLSKVGVERLECSGTTLAKSGPDISVASPWDSGFQTVFPTSGPFAVTPDGNAVWYIKSQAPLTLARYELARRIEVFSSVLPRGENDAEATTVFDIAVDPHVDRFGDVYVGTDMGTAMLDVNSESCLVGPDCWIGSDHIHYLHSPPSYADFGTSEVWMLHSVVEGGATGTYMGNEFWVFRLERNADQSTFLHSVLDFFGDREPGEVLTVMGNELGVFASLRGQGLVWRSTEPQDCGLLDGSPTRCERKMVSSCVPASTAALAGDAIALASLDGRVFVATAENAFEFLAGEGRLLPLQPASSPPIAGTLTDLTACDGTLFIGTDQGIWSMPLGDNS